MSSGTQPIEIARITKDGKFIVDNDRLYDLFDPHKDKELSIISVAGSYRTGKSFILNFFIRYLRERGWENRNWFGANDKRLQDGFDWKRGSNPHTKGIHVWPEVFDVSVGDGKQVAVMIVDTQGLFDNDNTPDTNAKIMSISTLLCSHQILNIQNRLQERDLEHLQLSVEYACAAVGLQDNSENTGKRKTTFQTLSFLVRDWVNDDEYPYGDGGNGYIESILETKSKSKTVNDVKESVHKAFEDVRGFLMPPPGKKVVKGEKATLVNADIKPAFRECTVKLVEAVLHPRNLILKQMFGRSFTASALMNLLAAVSKSFRDGKLPEIGTMLENTVRANNDEAVQKAVQRYRDVMKEYVADRIFAEAQLQEKNVEALGEATATFYQISTLGEDRDKDKAHQHAMKECDDYFRIVQEKNESNKSKAIEEMNNLSSALEIQYKETMNGLDLSKLTKEQLQAEHQSVCKTTLLQYEEATNQWRDNLSGIVKEKGSMLEKSLVSHYESLERERVNSENNKKIERQMNELKIDQVARDIYSEMQSTMAKYQDQYCPNIAELFQKERARCVGEYGTRTRNFDDYNKVKMSCDKLSGDMDQYFKDLLQRVNENNKRQLGEKYEQYVESALETYGDLMKRVTRGEDWKEAREFDNKNEEMKEKAINTFDQMIRNIKPALPSENVQKYRRALSLKIDKAFNGIYKPTNDHNRHLHHMKERMENSQAASFIEKALKFYEAGMSELFSNGSSCENLQDEHDKFKKRAENKFRDLCANISCDISKHLGSLNELINEKFSTFKTINKRNKEESTGKKKRECIMDAVSSYQRKMQEQVNAKSSLNEAFLKEKHEQYKNDAVSGFTKTMGNNATEEDKQDLKTRIEDKFSIYKNQNETNIEREKFKKQEHAASISQVNSARRDAYSSFERQMRKLADRYVTDIESVFKSEKTDALNSFDRTVNILRSKEGLSSIIQDEKNELSAEIDGYFDDAERINKKNKEIIELEQSNAVEREVNTYQSRLNEALSDVHVTDASIDACERKFLEEISRTLQPYPQSVMTRATSAIKEKTRIAKEQNEENKKHRPVEVKEEGFLSKVKGGAKRFGNWIKDKWNSIFS